MTTVAVQDPIGEVIAELRANTAVAAEVSDKVWGDEVPDKYHGQDLPVDPRPYILVRRLGVARSPRSPVATDRISITSVHKTPRQAALLYGLCSNALHIAGPRTNGSGLSIWLSKEEIGGQPQKDPQTGWPSEVAIYEVFAADQVTA